MSTTVTVQVPWNITDLILNPNFIFSNIQSVGLGLITFTSTNLVADIIEITDPVQGPYIVSVDGSGNATLWFPWLVFSFIVNGTTYTPDAATGLVVVPNADATIICVTNRFKLISGQN